MTPSMTPRPYRKRKRALLEEETRLRITEAAVELHGTVGPARTGVSEVARLAGVSRMTVYNHFPTEAELFQACSTHWAERHPTPDPAPWSEIGDPSERVRRALRELYRWYRRNEAMLDHVYRDVRVMPELAEVANRLWGGWGQEVVRVLAEGWTAGGTRDDAGLPAALRLATSFASWQSLRDAGLGPDRAADLAARMVEGAAGG